MTGFRFTLALVAVAVAAACTEPPTSVGSEDGREARLLTSLGAPLSWVQHTALRCADEDEHIPGTLRSVQSAYPLDRKGDFLLVGHSRCEPTPYDYTVLDLSGLQAVVVAGLAFDAPGVPTAAHSPPNSTVGFAGKGPHLIRFDGTFEVIAMPGELEPFDIEGVWAASPTQVWIAATRRDDPEAGAIIRWDGAQFTVEHMGGPYRALWGTNGGGGTLFAAGWDLLHRKAGGAWSVSLSRDDFLATCPAPDPPLPFPHRLHSLSGTGQNDVWATTLPAPCLLRFDGRSWTSVAPPADARALGAVFSVNRQKLFLSGQDAGGWIDNGLIALWSSRDGGATWERVQDPAFGGLPNFRHAGFLTLAGLHPGTRIYAPSFGGTLFEARRGGAGR
jgi:hypothetical protein